MAPIYSVLEQSKSRKPNKIKGLLRPERSALAKLSHTPLGKTLGFCVFSFRLAPFLAPGILKQHGNLVYSHSKNRQ